MSDFQDTGMDLVHELQAEIKDLQEDLDETNTELLSQLEIIGQIAETWCGKTDRLVSDVFFTIAEKCRVTQQSVQSGGVLVSVNEVGEITCKVCGRGMRAKTPRH